MNRKIAQWQLMIFLIAIIYIFQILSSAFTWIQQNLLLIFYSIAIILSIFFFIIIMAKRDARKSDHTHRKQESTENGDNRKIADIKNSINNTPKLTRYAWSDNDYYLIKQWETYKEAGITPVRRKTAARRARAEKNKAEQTPYFVVKPPLVWRGEMKCDKCQYLWKSRRSSRPAQCPSCRSKNITQLKF